MIPNVSGAESPSIEGPVRPFEIALCQDALVKWLAIYTQAQRETQPLSRFSYVEILILLHYITRGARVWTHDKSSVTHRLNNLLYSLCTFVMCVYVSAWTIWLQISDTQWKNWRREWRQYERWNRRRHANHRPQGWQQVEHNVQRHDRARLNRYERLFVWRQLKSLHVFSVRLFLSGLFDALFSKWSFVPGSNETDEQMLSGRDIVCHVLYSNRENVNMVHEVFRQVCHTIRVIFVAAQFVCGVLTTLELRLYIVCDTL